MVSCYVLRERQNGTTHDDMQTAVNVVGRARLTLCEGTKQSNVRHLAVFILETTKTSATN